MSGLATARKKLVVALDGNSMARAQELVETLRDAVDHFEIGVELFTACGPAVVTMVRDHGGTVFLDLKYHDIPAVVGKAVAAAAQLGVGMINVHAAGGRRMMEEALEAVARAKLGRATPRLIAVTVLTSMETLADIGVQYEVRQQVVRLAKLAMEVGLDGVLASSLEIQPIRKHCGARCCIVAAGIRLPGDAPNDQRRIGGPRQAIAAGADFLVVGRPITEAKDPKVVVQSILKDMV